MQPYPLEKKKALSEYCIDNGGTLEELHETIYQLMPSITRPTFFQKLMRPVLGLVALAIIYSPVYYAFLVFG